MATRHTVKVLACDCFPLRTWWSVRRNVRAGIYLQGCSVRQDGVGTWRFDTTWRDPVKGERSGNEVEFSGLEQGCRGLYVLTQRTSPSLRGSEISRMNSYCADYENQFTGSRHTGRGRIGCDRGKGFIWEISETQRVLREVGSWLTDARAGVAAGWFAYHGCSALK